MKDLLKRMIPEIIGEEELRITEEPGQSLTIENSRAKVVTRFVGDKYEVKALGRVWCGTVNDPRLEEIRDGLREALEPRPLEIIEGLFGNINPTKMFKEGEAKKMRIEYDSDGSFGFSLALSDGSVMIITGDSWKIFKGHNLIEKGGIHD